MGEGKYIENGKLKHEYVGMKFGIIHICNNSFRRIPYGNHGGHYGIVRAECDHCGFRFDVDLYHLIRKGDRKHCPSCAPRRFGTTEDRAARFRTFRRKYPEVTYSDSSLDQFFTQRMSDKQIVERFYKTQKKYAATIVTRYGPYRETPDGWKKTKVFNYAPREYPVTPGMEEL